MSKMLVFKVYMHEGRFHGTGDWPPAPARFFQALIAGAGISGRLNSSQISALEWLENCASPVIGAPSARKGQSVGNFVPNNDLDAKGGDPRNLSAIRTKKIIRPFIFDPAVPFHYAWSIPDDAEGSARAESLSRLAETVYQLGRGVDFAWADTELLSKADFEDQLEHYPGTVHRPTAGGDGGVSLPCPTKGTFTSLEARYDANASRFETVTNGRTISQSFRQQPKARFKFVTYDSPPTRRIFEFRQPHALEKFSYWPLHQTYSIATNIRDKAAQRLKDALPHLMAEIDRWVIGRKADGSNGGSPEERIRLVPLPSIGHEHSDHGIRRVLIEIPPGTPFPVEDILWAFSALELEISGVDAILIPSERADMLEFYVARKGAVRWRTVTPAALPEAAGRRRIEPSRRLAEAKGADEKGSEQIRAAGAVMKALRHAGISSRIEQIILQREPFTGHGQRVESFATGTRFAKERLWHVELLFSEPRYGPIVIGDGRFCGLGVLAPVK